MVRVEEGSNEALAVVVANLRDADVREMLALAPSDDVDWLRGSLISRYADRQDTYAAFDDDEPVAFGIMTGIAPDVVAAGFFATDHFADVALPVARFVKRCLLPAYRGYRVECVIMADYESSIGFVEMLGFRQQEVLLCFGRHGENFLRFAWSG